MFSIFKESFANPCTTIAADCIPTLPPIAAISGIKKANSEIISKSKSLISYEEGCLSIPGQFWEIARPDSCVIKFLDQNGREKKIKTEGLLATCIQHEIDHLDGKLFVDYISNMKRDRIAKKIKKLTEQGKLETRNDVPYSI